MRVLFFNYEYPPLGGGAASATFCILEEYTKIPNLKVDLITSSVDDKTQIENITSGITVHRLPIGKNQSNLHFQSQKDLLIYAWRAYWYSRKLLRQNKYNLTHSFFTVPCGFLSLILKYQYKLPYIVSLRGSDVPGYSDRFSFIYNFLKPLVIFIWKRAAFVVANSSGLKDLALESNSGQKIEVIYNGVNIERFRPNEYVKDKQKFIIVSTSRIIARKGIGYLIEAVAKLIFHYPHLRLNIIGEGNEEENLKKLAKNLKLENQIKFLGRVSYENIAKHYQEADIFVLPSLNEGMSNTMLEALASGLPLVVTDTGGTKELVVDGGNGFIIKMENSDDIAKKIETFLKDKELTRKMGENSRRKAEEMSWKSVAEKYFEIYKKVSNEEKNF